MSQRRDSMDDSARHGSRTEGINHYFLFNVGESVDGYGRSGYIFQTIPYPSHHSGDLGRPSGFYSYSNGRIGNRSQTIQFSSLNHGRIYIDHPRFPQKYNQRGVEGEIQNKVFFIILIQA